MDLKVAIPIISAVGLFIGGAGFLFWSVISGFKKRQAIANQTIIKSQEEVERAHTELVTVLNGTVTSWKKRYDDEHTEFANYRQKVHDKDQSVNARVLRLTEENAELKGKTDLTPVLRFHQEQGQINVKVVQSLDAILAHLKSLEQKAA